MKKLFLVLSTLCVTLFIVFSISSRKQDIDYRVYPSVTVFDVSRDANNVYNRIEVDSQLTQLTNESNSTIGKLVIKPNKEGIVNYQFEKYGTVDLPQQLNTVSLAEKDKTSVVSTYIITSGSLSETELQQLFQKSGYVASALNQTSIPRLFVQVSATYVSILILLTFILTFSGIVIVSNLKQVKQAGIRLVSGQSFFNLLNRFWLADFIPILITTAVSYLLGLVILLGLGLFTTRYILILSCGLIFYFLILVITAFILTCLNLFALKQERLMNLIKGKISLKKIMVIVSVNQLLGVILMGVTLFLGVIYYGTYQDQVKASQSWEQNSEFYQFDYSVATGTGNPQDKKKLKESWYEAANETVNLGLGMLVDGMYSATSHELYVTPNYLTNQNIELDRESTNILMNLQPGQFGILVPDNLKSQEAQIVQAVTANVQDLSDRDKGPGQDYLMTVSPVVSTIKSGQSRFMMNTSNIDSQQFIEDPIIVVITPQSTGKTELSGLFWETNRLFYRDYDQALALFERHGLSQYVAYFEKAQSVYLNNVNDMKTRTISLLIGLILMIVTSVILFSSMNMIYFEQFRRAILIKRLSGLNFIEIHGKYLLAELLVLISGVSIFWLVFRDSAIASITLGLMSAILGSIMFIQNKKEQQTAMTVMKGK